MGFEFGPDSYRDGLRSIRIWQSYFCARPNGAAGRASVLLWLIPCCEATTLSVLQNIPYKIMILRKSRQVIVPAAGNTDECYFTWI